MFSYHMMKNILGHVIGPRIGLHLYIGLIGSHLVTGYYLVIENYYLVI